MASWDIQLLDIRLGFMHNEASEAKQAHGIAYSTTKKHLEVDFGLRVMSLAHGSFYWTLKDAIVLAAHAKGFSHTLARKYMLYQSGHGGWELRSPCPQPFS
jgi:hypothetical protein